jgi:hypothetical protein
MSSHPPTSCVVCFIRDRYAHFDSQCHTRARPRRGSVCCSSRFPAIVSHHCSVFSSLLFVSSTQTILRSMTGRTLAVGRRRVSNSTRVMQQHAGSMSTSTSTLKRPQTMHLSRRALLFLCSSRTLPRFLSLSSPRRTSRSFTRSIDCRPCLILILPLAHSFYHTPMSLPSCPCSFD